jgi:hypothetical protein
MRPGQIELRLPADEKLTADKKSVALLFLWI